MSHSSGFAPASTALLCGRQLLRGAIKHVLGPRLRRHIDSLYNHIGGAITNLAAHVSTIGGGAAPRPALSCVSVTTCACLTLPLSARPTICAAGASDYTKDKILETVAGLSKVRCLVRTGRRGAAAPRPASRVHSAGAHMGSSRALIRLSLPC